MMKSWAEMAKLTPEQEKAPYAHFYYRPAPEFEPWNQKVLEQGSSLRPEDAILAENISDMLHPERIKAESGYCVLPDGTGYVAVLHRWPGITMDMYNFWNDWWTKEDSETRYKIWCPGKHVGAFFTYTSEDIGGNLEEIYFGGSVRQDPSLLGLNLEEMKKSNCVMTDGGNALSKTYGAGEQVPPTAGVVCHFMYQEEDGLTMRSRFWFGYQVLGGGLVKMLAPGTRVSESMLKGIFEHNVLEMACLRDLLPPLYKQEVLDKQEKE